jgi:Protein of unknown function (DUF2442)
LAQTLRKLRSRISRSMDSGSSYRVVCVNEFPWFKDATVSAILNVHLPSPHHLYWPALDIDLAVESIEHPDHFPLISKAARAQRKTTTSS